MSIEPGCRWRVRITGDIACMQPGAIDWAGIAQVTIALAFLVLLMAFMVYLLRQRHLEQAMEHAVQQARFNRFIGLLRDVKWNLLDRTARDQAGARLWLQPGYRASLTNGTLDEAVAHRDDAGAGAVREKKAEEVAELRRQREALVLLGGGIGVLIIGFAIFALMALRQQGERITTGYQIRFMLGAALVALVLNAMLWLIHWLQTMERRPTLEQERGEAQLNKFHELLRDVKFSLLHRNGA